ncbi:MAG: hypothetical protein KGI28_00635 [Thaumarchaeota archaeon]|nr:hypothetical protein [Nitrososphaerota archaeon]
MSHSDEPSDSSKPVVKDKNPHNYRKVGYTMIVISVSLVLIGLLVLELGSNYHFSGDIMAKQEIDAMTPKNGYTIVAFDYTQPVGAKIQLLGTANNFDDAVQLKKQYTPNYQGQKGQVLIFDTSTKNNTLSVSLAEVYAMTPTSGYNIVSFNTGMPVGARLSPQTLDSSLGAATNDSARYSTANVDQQVKILTFTSSFDDNMQQILGPSYSPTMSSENINQITLTPPKLISPPPPALVVQNTITTTPVNATSVNQTKSTIPTVPSSQNLGVNTTIVTQSVKNNATSVSKIGQSPENLGMNSTVSIHVSHMNNTAASTTNNTSAKLANQKSISVSDNVGIQAK